MANVIFLAGEEIVNTQYVIVSGQELVAEVATDKASAPSNQDPFSHNDWGPWKYEPPVPFLTIRV